MDIEYFNKLKSKGAGPTEIYLNAKELGYNTIDCVFVIRKICDLSLIEAKSIIVAADNNGMSLSQYQENIVPIITEVLKHKEK